MGVVRCGLEPQGDGNAVRLSPAGVAAAAEHLIDGIGLEAMSLRPADNALAAHEELASYSLEI